MIDLMMRQMERPSAPEASLPAIAPCLFVIFGATGSLARKDLVPALFELAVRGLLPERFAVLGSSRTGWSDETFRRRMRESVGDQAGFTETAWEDFGARLHYVAADAQGDAGEGWDELVRCAHTLRDRHGLEDKILFHLAVPPELFGDIVRQLARTGLSRPKASAGWRRLIVEKPFGSDRRSARELDRRLLEDFDEESIYRIDHYLGKETVQNLLVTRFANPSLEPIWNRNYVDHVQITVAESEGIGTRGGFYESTGVVRDMVQNHVLQLLSMVAAEPPVRCVGGSLRDETAKVLDSVRPVDLERDFVVGQYGAGRIDGEPVRAYRGEEGVAPDSATPTFAALRLTLDSWRWAGVPFYARTGKRLPRKVTELAVHFKATPQTMFPGQDACFRSALTFRLQPDEGIVQTLAVKRPGPALTIQPADMVFSYADAFGMEEPPRAYAWLLHDAMQGDQTLFARSDWIDKSWALIDPLVRCWQEAGPAKVRTYDAGSWGPAAADELLAREGREWRLA